MRADADLQIIRTSPGLQGIKLILVPEKASFSFSPQSILGKGYQERTMQKSFTLQGIGMPATGTFYLTLFCSYGTEIKEYQQE
jgi:hypothetical protein